jgi:hypothetical protein
MKTITTTVYQCEKCKSKYTNEASAIACEESHINCTNERISDLLYPVKGLYPNYITVLMDDNTAHRYKITEGQVD